MMTVDDNTPDPAPDAVRATLAKVIFAGQSMSRPVPLRGWRRLWARILDRPLTEIQHVTIRTTAAGAFEPSKVFPRDLSRTTDAGDFSGPVLP